MGDQTDGRECEGVSAWTDMWMGGWLIGRRTVGWMDGWMVECTDGRMGGRVDEGMCGMADERMGE